MQSGEATEMMRVIYTAKVVLQYLIVLPIELGELYSLSLSRDVVKIGAKVWIRGGVL